MKKVVEGRLYNAHPLRGERERKRVRESEERERACGLALYGKCNWHLQEDNGGFL
jgi:hypothetical protein